MIWTTSIHSGAVRTHLRQALPPRPPALRQQPVPSQQARPPQQQRHHLSLAAPAQAWASSRHPQQAPSIAPPAWQPAAVVTPSTFPWRPQASRQLTPSRAPPSHLHPAAQCSSLMAAAYRATSVPLRAAVQRESCSLRQGSTCPQKRSAGSACRPPGLRSPAPPLCQAQQHHHRHPRLQHQPSNLPSLLSQVVLCAGHNSICTIKHCHPAGFYSCSQLPTELHPDTGWQPHRESDAVGDKAHHICRRGALAARPGLQASGLPPHHCAGCHCTVIGTPGPSTTPAACSACSARSCA